MRTRTKSKEEADPRQVLADLEEAVRNGDNSVSPAALAKARQAAEHADLLDEARERQRQREAAAQRDAAIAALRKDIASAGDSGELARLRDAYTHITDALRSFEEQVSAWQKARTALITRARRLGLVDEAEALPDLSSQDWLSLAKEEAQGRFKGDIRRRKWNNQIDPPAHHSLRSPSERERIEGLWQEREQKAQERIEADKARKQALRDEKVARERADRDQSPPDPKRRRRVVSI